MKLEEYIARLKAERSVYSNRAKECSYQRGPDYFAWNAATNVLTEVIQALEQEVLPHQDDYWAPTSGRGKTWHQLTDEERKEILDSYPAIFDRDKVMWHRKSPD